MSTLVLSSLTPQTGNAITADRIARAVGGTTADIADFASPQALGHALAARGVRLVFAVHAFRAGRLVLGCGVPFVVILGGTDANIHIHEAEKRPVILAALRAAEAVVSFNRELQLAVLEAAPEVAPKMFVLPQAITSPLVPAPAGEAHASLRAAAVLEALDVRPGEELLLLPAGLRPVKDVLFAAEAMAGLAGHEPRVVMRIVGPRLDAAYADQVAAALGALSPPRAVAYCGPLPQEELHCAMASARAVLNTSTSEGMCNSLLEAMLLGSPVVARANSGNAALITHGRNGLLGETGAQLVAHVRALLADGGELARTLAAEGRAYVSAHHSVEAEAEQYRELMRFASSGQGGPCAAR